MIYGGRKQAQLVLAAMLLVPLAAADQVFNNSDEYTSGALGGVVLQTYHSTNLTPPALNIKTGFGTDAISKTNHTLISFREGEKSSPIIIDNEGHLVWSGQNDHVGGMGLEVQELWGEPVLTFYSGRVFPRGYGRGHWKVLAQNYTVIRTISGVNLPPDSADAHEVLITPDNTAIVESYVLRQTDLSSIGGPVEGWVFEAVVQEIDLRDDKLLFEWHSLDHIPVTESYHLPLGGLGSSPETPLDYAHLNSLHKDARGNYLFSLRGLSAVYSVNATDGSTIWRLGGKSSSFELGENARFWYQHAARFRSDITKSRFNISLFDNAADIGKDEEPTARGLVLTLDEEAWTATVAAEYLPSHGTTSPSQGNIDYLDDGNVIVGWGSEPYFSQYTQAGELVYDVAIASKAGGSDAQSYRAHRSAWHGHPTTLPSLSLNTTSGKAYASWNGATEVGKWVLLGGNDKARLRPLGEVRKTGFETRLPLHKGVEFYAVAAASAKHGRGKKYLGTSKVYFSANATAAGDEPAVALEEQELLVLQKGPLRVVH